MNDGIYSISEYIDTKASLLGKITAINQVISAMELKLLDVSESTALDEYSVDDGQMKVRTKYRSVADVMAGISGLEALKQRYVNRYNGRRTVFKGGNF